jgi:hypothetical protein
MQHDGWYVAIRPGCAGAEPPVAMASLVSWARVRRVIVKA